VCERGEGRTVGGVGVYARKEHYAVSHTGERLKPSLPRAEGAEQKKHRDNKHNDNLKAGGFCDGHAADGVDAVAGFDELTAEHVGKDLVAVEGGEDGPPHLRRDIGDNGEDVVAFADELSGLVGVEGDRDVGERVELEDQRGDRLLQDPAHLGRRAVQNQQHLEVGLGEVLAMIASGANCGESLGAYGRTVLPIHHKPHGRHAGS